jgi:predicted Rossmann fold nucleotide-binding protein DprA/Smf involved in DNA uptake
MTVTPQTQAILLLTAYFSRPAKDDPKPLSTKEWARFAEWLKDHNLNPEHLMNGHQKTSLQTWTDKYVTPDRIEQLMNRGTGLALAMEKWTRAGLWVLTRSDENYPSRLKQLLKTDCPPVLFGAGNAKLLNQGGIAVIGARNANESDLEFSKNIGKRAATQRRSIVSGGARGVDEAAMLGALEVEGTVIGVMADSLLKAATSKKYRQHLVNNNLVLVSPYYPEAGFNAGNAMSRNKYIYCLSNAAVVVQSGTKGGTWNGALENLKNNWVPLWVKKTDDVNSGNALIIKKGGLCLSENLSQLNVDDLFNMINVSDTESHTEDIFSQSVVREDLDDFETTKKPAKDEKAPDTSGSLSKITLYQLFLIKLCPLISESAKTTDELISELEVNKTQLNTWLKQAVKENKIGKLNKPVRYQWKGNDIQIGMFEK